MLGPLFSLYSFRYPRVIVYMLQSTEYQVWPYLKWLIRTRDFNKVMHRRKLDPTPRALALLQALRAGITVQFIVGLAFIIYGISQDVHPTIYYGAAIIVIYPLLWPFLLTIPLLLAKYLIVLPRELGQIKRSERIFQTHPGIKIAVAGSYGKTTMKELLLTVLAEGRRVAATPANKNVASSHAAFALALNGEEEILIIEYGEGKPGDVSRFARTTHPTHGIVTGVAPAHLDHYKTVTAAGRDIFSLAGFLPKDQFYVHTSDSFVTPFLKPGFKLFDTHNALGWQINDITVDASGTSFVMHKGKTKLKLSSGLVGRHQAAFLAFVAALALELGLTQQQVRDGIAKTMPFEHRMQPYRLAGAWIIDDTYNGNLEGIRAGTELLASLPAQRKIYVTPGLVDQGIETKQVHIEMGKLIAASGATIAVLMKNSVTPFIQQGLKDNKFKGEVRIEDDPLQFYSQLQYFVANGDLVLMQNDWPDNYA